MEHQDRCDEDAARGGHITSRSFPASASFVGRIPAPVRARLRDLVERVEPPIAVPRLRWGKQPLPPLGIGLVYRARNSATVEKLLDSTRRPVRAALWALDDISPALAGRTVGTGPGTRVSLLNRTVDALKLPDDAWLLLADDDVKLCRGDLDDLLQLAAYVGLDVAQPTHAAGSTHLWGINRHRVLTMARSTRFVETGPALLMSPLAQRLCLPFRSEFAMGIGSEAVWGGRTELRLGVLDAVTMRHMGVVGGAYNGQAEWDRTLPFVTNLLKPLGVSSLKDLAHEEGRWRWWQTRPIWAQR